MTDELRKRVIDEINATLDFNSRVTFSDLADRIIALCMERAAKVAEEYGTEDAQGPLKGLDLKEFVGKYGTDSCAQAIRSLSGGGK